MRARAVRRKEKTVKSMNVEDYNDRKWVVLGAQCRLLYADTFAEPVAREYSRTFGLPTEILGLCKGTFIEWLYDHDQLVALSEKLLGDLKPNPWRYYETWREKAHVYSLFHQETMRQALTVLTDQALEELIKKYISVFRDQFASSNIIEPLSYYFQHHARDLLLKNGAAAENIEALLDAFGRSKYPNYIKECLAEYQAAKTPKEIQVVLQKYHYLSNDYLGPKPVTVEYLEELRKHEAHEAQPHTHIEIAPGAREILEVFQMIATLQDVRKAYSLMMVSGIHYLVNEYSRRLEIPLSLLWNAIWDEVFSGKLDQDKLKKRTERCVIFWGKEDTLILEGQEAEEFAQEMSQVIFGKTDELKEVKGICASPGKVAGRAVVIMHPDEFHKVKKGDVIFTMMTRPEYLPVMQLASAFVTDEGGITSHAAIVAREMKKPCIIATKHGTKVVKDGDMVEVDANKGMVRILEKI